MNQHRLFFTKKTNLIKIVVSTLIVLMAVVLALFSSYKSSNVEAASSMKDSNITYNSVEKHIVINEQKVCDITEIITLTYRESGINLGISRNVSRVNKITRIVNGKKYVTKTTNKLTLLDVTMNDEPEYHFLEKKGDYYYINTGADGDFKKKGTYVYQIHYLYDMGEDFIDAFDDFTFDIMDYGFRGSVGSFKASITLPKSFITSSIYNDLTFRTNNMQSIGADAVHLQLDEESNTIHCHFATRLSSGEGITLQLILPQGYFDTSYTPSSFYYIVLWISLACAVGIALIVLISRRAKHGTIVPEFDPPKGYSVTDCAMIYRGRVRSKDFASMIIEWASLGYVKLEIISRRQIILTKLKEIPLIRNSKTGHSNSEERDYFNALFKSGRIKYDTKKERFKYDSKLGKAVDAIYKREGEQVRALVLYRLGITLLALVPFIFFTIWASTTGLGGSIPAFIILLFPTIAMLVFTYVPMPFWFKIIWCSGFGGAPLGIMISEWASPMDVFHLMYLIVAIFVVGTLSGKLVRAYRKQDASIRDHLLGFKMFLVTAEKEELERMIEDNPEYYYNVLPYCYIFGITRKMEKKFSSLNVPQPTNIVGNYSNAYMVSCLSHSVSSMGGRSSSSGGSGGGGGGGGSSGGGGGGGGCGGR